MVDFNEIVGQLQGAGFFDVLLPFLLIFVVLFAILEKIKIFGTEKDGEPRKNINLMFALITSLIVIINTEIIAIMNIYLSKISLIIIIFLMFMVVFGLWAGEKYEPAGWLFFLGIIIAILGTVWALTPEIGFNLPDWLYPTEWDGPLVIGLIVTGLTLFFLFSDGNKGHDHNSWLEVRQKKQ
ncbi:hypothetical protein HYW75_06875 [Candidatus Pacearchaeota archaeon]|nr:hypothetical protein [Candidatus Pacearchaeota archaeon]